MGKKISVSAPLVVLHGDEMAQVAFEQILEKFVSSRLDIPLVEIDLSAEKRLQSNGDVVRESIAALRQHGVGIKNAGMTVNRQQLDELLTKYPEIDEAKLDKLATKSPNGAIRKGIGGNITRGATGSCGGGNAAPVCCVAADGCRSEGFPAHQRFPRSQIFRIRDN